MGWANLAVAVASMIAGAVAAYFGYVAVRGQLQRRNTGSDASHELGRGETYDVFISYADADAGPAQRLAIRLRDEGLRVFLAESIGIGLIDYLEKEKALLGSANGILVFSRTTMTDPKIRDEYAALLQRAHSGGRRFVPVLIEDVDLPPFARIRRPLDLRDHGTREYGDHIAALVRALRSRERDTAV